LVRVSDETYTLAASAEVIWLTSASSVGVDALIYVAFSCLPTISYLGAISAKNSAIIV